MHRKFLKKISFRNSFGDNSLFQRVLLISAFLIVVGSLGMLSYTVTVRPGILVFVSLAQGVFLMLILGLYALQAQSLKRAGTQLRKDSILLENRLQALEASGDGIGIVNAMGSLTYVNPALLRFHGIESNQTEAYLGIRWEELFGHGIEEKGVSSATKDLYSHGYWRGASKVVNDQTKEDVLLELSFSLLPDGGFIGTARDVTAQHKADIEKKELEEQFFQAQKMEAVGRLAGGVAHDFNNILAAMNGYAEFLVEDLEGEPDKKKFAENILKAGLQARSLVDQMLAFSRRDNSGSQVVDVLVPIRESVSMLRASLSKAVELQVELGVEKAPVEANATQISQLVMNLSVNAADAIGDGHGMVNIMVDTHAERDLPEFLMRVDSFSETGEEPPIKIEEVGSIKTRLSLGYLKKEQAYFSLLVKDTGMGMSREVMEHIFEPFFTTKPVGKGTGLGLATVHGVVVSHQGAMIIESETGQGTTFKIYFPALEVLSEHDDLQVVDAEDKGKGRILLVEDQEDVREMLQNMVERLGYDVTIALNGLEALDVIRENPDAFDVIMTDQNMPKMTGIQLVQQVYIDFPDMAFIVLSGHSLQKLQVLISEHPAIKGVLRKPANKKDVATAIAKVLKETRAQEAA